MYHLNVAQKKKERHRPKFRSFSSHTRPMGCQAHKHLRHLPRRYITMILEKAIFIKLKNLKFSDQQLFDAAVSGFNPSRHTCRICGAVGRFSEIHSYQRDMISANGSVRVDTRLSIRRFQCGSCGHTHALLPDVLIPYGSYSLRFILTVLLCYLKRSSTVTNLCRYWGIAVSTLYDWIHLFIIQYNSWCSVLDRILWVCRSAVSSICDFPAFPSEFLLRFGFSFLRGRSATPSGSIRLPDRRLRPHPT